MLHFCNDNEESSLIAHLFSISISKNGNSYVATAKQMFPTSDESSDLIKNVELFAYPDSSAIESKSFFTFVIGDTHCDFYIGFVQYSNSFSAKCILSNFFYPDLFQYILNLPENELLDQVKALNRSEIRQTLIFPKKTFYLDGGHQRQQILKFLFDIFTPFDISKIVIGLLQARHIFCVSSNVSTCCQLAAALPLLIQPFRWDMNTIPVLPIKLKEMTQVPVPTLIGLTRPEVLSEGRVSSHIIVNADLKLVIDEPSLDSHNLTTRLTVLAQQAKVANTLTAILNAYSKSPGFPHIPIQKAIQNFMFSYLQIYTGPVKTQEQFITAVSKLPEFLETSQVIQDLINKDRVPQEVLDGFQKWFDDIFKGKSKDRHSIKLAKHAVRSPSQNDVNLLDFSSTSSRLTPSASTPGLAEMRSPLADKGNSTDSNADFFVHLTDSPSLNHHAASSAQSSTDMLFFDMGSNNTSTPLIASSLTEDESSKNGADDLLSFDNPTPNVDINQSLSDNLGFYDIGSSSSSVLSAQASAQLTPIKSPQRQSQSVDFDSLLSLVPSTPQRQPVQPLDLLSNDQPGKENDFQDALFQTTSDTKPKPQNNPYDFLF